jgi:hypothetical protein
MTANPMVANSRPSGVLNIKAASARLDTLIVGEGKGFAAFTADLENPIFKLFYSNSAPIIYRVSLNRGKSKEEKEEIIQTVRYIVISI